MKQIRMRSTSGAGVAGDCTVKVDVVLEGAHTTKRDGMYGTERKRCWRDWLRGKGSSSLVKCKL